MRQGIADYPLRPAIRLTSITMAVRFSWSPLLLSRSSNDQMTTPSDPGKSVRESLAPVASDCQQKSSIAAIWTRFEDQLRRRARTRLRQYGLAGQAESMDICNDVMADLTRRFGDADMTSDDVLAYVLKAIDNQVLDTFRLLARQCRDFRRNDSTSVDQLPVAHRHSTPSQLALRREVVDRIRSALSDEDARAVDMILENRDWLEIGAALGVKPDTVRMRVRRAIDQVRKEIGADGPDR